MSQLLIDNISIYFNIFHTFSIITSNFIGRHLPFHPWSFRGRRRRRTRCQDDLFFFKPTSIGDNHDDVMNDEFNLMVLSTNYLPAIFAIFRWIFDGITWYKMDVSWNLDGI